MRGIKVLVVEDEVLIAHTIQFYLEERGHVCLDIAISYDEAVTKYNELEPDIVLLDIRLYGVKSGIDFAKYLSSRTHKTPYVFLTSQFDKAAVNKVIETKPAGYLTKPIIKESLWTTIEVAILNAKTIVSPRITITDGTETHLLLTEDIQYIHAQHVYIKLYLNNGKQILSRLPLKQIMEKLDDSIFSFCHRSYIVNTKSVKSWSKSAVKINDVFIPISRSRRSDLLEILESHN